MRWSHARGIGGVTVMARFDAIASTMRRALGEGYKRWFSGNRNNGLCATILCLWEDGLIGLGVVRRMEKKIRKHMETADPRHSPFGWPDTRNGAIARADFCKAQAELLKVEVPT